MIYIFCGDDKETINKNIERLVEAQGLRCMAFSDVKSMCAHIYQTSLISKKNALVARYDDDFLKAESSWADFIKSCEDKTVVLVFEKIDKRSAFYKTFEHYIVEFKEEDENYVFGFVGAFLRRDVKEEIRCAGFIKPSDAIGAISLLYSKLRMVLQMQTTPKGVTLEANTGLAQRLLYFNKEYLNIYSDDDLIYLMRLCSMCIDKIKSGELDTNVALWYIIVYGG